MGIEKYQIRFAKNLKPAEKKGNANAKKGIDKEMNSIIKKMKLLEQIFHKKVEFNSKTAFDKRFNLVKYISKIYYINFLLTSSFESLKLYFND